MALMEARNKKFLVLLLLLLVRLMCFRVSWSQSESPQQQPPQQGSGSKFPRVDLTLMNQAEQDVYYICDFPGYDKFFHLLKVGEKISWDLELIFFPTKWCYVYYNDHKHGFFWLYTVRLKCLKCDWVIKERPYVLRLDRDRWESSDIYTIPQAAMANPK